MTAMNPAQTRVIDPILTTHAQGYIRPATSWRVLFPTADVSQYAGKVMQFGKEHFRRYNTKRARGSDVKTVTFGYEGKPYAIESRALGAVVPWEDMLDAAAVPGIDLMGDAVDLVLDVCELDLEYDAAAIARATASYEASHRVALAGQARWAGNASNPTADIETAKDVVRQSIGIRPNTVLLSPSAFKAAKQHPAIKEDIKYTQRALVTAEILSSLWEINVHVAESIGASGQDDTLSDIWGHDVIVAYVAPPTGGNKRNAAKPSYGYTYQIRGMPSVSPPRNEEGKRSWIAQVSADREPQLTGMHAGYLIQNAGAAPA